MNITDFGGKMFWREVSSLQIQSQPTSDHMQHFTRKYYFFCLEKKGIKLIICFQLIRIIERFVICNRIRILPTKEEIRYIVYTYMKI